MTNNTTHDIPGPGESWEGRTPTRELVNEVLRLHGMWQRGEKGGVRADLSDADLRGANLSRIDMTGAKLRGANLRSADLREASLSGTDLSGTNLRDANLFGADLSNARLRGANLRGAILRDADLSGAQLTGADMRGTDLRGANLSDANLFGADMSGANLRGTDLSGATLPDGRTYEQWRADPLAGLCDDPESTQRATEAWGGRTWQDCPMHAAHGWNSLDDAPQNKRSLAATFIALLDGGHLPRPEVQS